MVSPHVANRTRDLLATNARDDALGPTLRSGLYIVRPAFDNQELIYVIYWPEKDTWDDNADDSVRRNRVTFMRYVLGTKPLVIHTQDSTQIPHQDH